MVKTLTRIGDDLGLILDQRMLDLLHIDRDTTLEVTVDGKGFYVRPVDGDHRSRVIDAAQRVMEIHEETLRKLAQ